jgi:hypothetical protein
VVRARKADAAALRLHGLLSSRLVALALELTRGEDDAVESAKPNDDQEGIETICRLSLVDSDITSDLLPYEDRVALYRWAMVEEVPPAVPEPGLPRQWGERDLEPLVKNQAVLLLDAAAKRYGVRPSELLGLCEEDKWVALSLDLACAYRGMKQESRSGDDMVEVEDQWGNKHKIPRRMAMEGGASEGVAPNTRVVKAEDYGQAYGPITLSAGGLAGDGQIGPMPVKGSISERPWDALWKNR